jgi:hypothetical protein
MFVQQQQQQPMASLFGGGGGGALFPNPNAFIGGGGGFGTATGIATASAGGGAFLQNSNVFGHGGGGFGTATGSAAAPSFDWNATPPTRGGRGGRGGFGGLVSHSLFGAPQAVPQHVLRTTASPFATKKGATGKLVDNACVFGAVKSTASPTSGRRSRGSAASPQRHGSLSLSQRGPSRLGASKFSSNFDGLRQLLAANAEELERLGGNALAKLEPTTAA